MPVPKVPNSLPCSEIRNREVILSPQLARHSLMAFSNNPSAVRSVVDQIIVPTTV